MAKITQIYRTGNPRQWTLTLACGHKAIATNDDLTYSQVYLGKDIPCGICDVLTEKPAPETKAALVHAFIQRHLGSGLSNDDIAVLTKSAGYTYRDLIDAIIESRGL